MKVTSEEIKVIVQRVLTYYLRKKEYDKKENSILMMVPSDPIQIQDLLAEYELYGELENIDFFCEDEHMELPGVGVNQVLYKYKKSDLTYVFKNLAKYEKLEIYTPSLDFLRKLKEGKEDDIFVRITLYFIMTHKNVIARLPYKSDELPNSTFTKSVRDLLGDLWDMGISVADLVPTFGDAMSMENPEKMQLITEGVIEEHARLGGKLIYINADDIVTPLAREKAKELNIKITMKNE